MDANQMIEGAFQELEQGLEHALEGLTPEELTWRPNEEANSINFLFWHIS
ncbi:MAG: DinB family protein, partial [Chloroflexi bacterium]|nr:DinB family protein [Chloroflexota bacterium]